VTQLLQFLVAMVLGIVLPAWLIRYDERSLSDPQRERAFGFATYWIAVVVFGPFCLPVHFVRTRRSLWGLGLGLIALAGTLAAIAGASAALSIFLE
jgi:hypothetical protein